MKVVLHLGAHMTDEDRLINCLIRNRELLASHGTDVPTPGSYRKTIRALIRQAAETALSEDARDVVMGAIAAEQEPERLILSGPGFLGTPKMAAHGGTLYSAIEARIGYFHQIFPHDQIEIFFGIRNLASFLPAVFSVTSFTSMTEFLRGTDPTEIRWCDMVERLRAAFPKIPITIWCNEDTPLIWAEVMRELAGLDPMAVLQDEFALLEEIMSEIGMQRFRSYVASHKGMTEVQKRRVIAAFMDKFVIDTAIEEELDVPGWTEGLVDRLTELYDDDVFAIQRLPGVNMITP